MIFRGPVQPEIPYKPRSAAIKLTWCLYFFHKGKRHSSEEKEPLEEIEETIPHFSQAFKCQKKHHLGTEGKQPQHVATIQKCNNPCVLMSIFLSFGILICALSINMPLPSSKSLLWPCRVSLRVVTLTALMNSDMEPLPPALG